MEDSPAMRPDSSTHTLDLFICSPCACFSCSWSSIYAESFILIAWLTFIRLFYILLALHLECTVALAWCVIRLLWYLSHSALSIVQIGYKDGSSILFLLWILCSTIACSYVTLPSLLPVCTWSMSGNKFFISSMHVRPYIPCMHAIFSYLVIIYNTSSCTMNNIKENVIPWKCCCSFK